MNFDRFAQKIKASAAIAAEAAANFQGFDEMAANDDYVQSPDFNVHGRSRKAGERNLAQQQHFDDASTLSTHSSFRASTIRPTTDPSQTLSHQLQQPANPTSNNNDSNPNYAASSSIFRRDTTESTNNNKTRQLVPLKVSVPERQIRLLRPNKVDDEDDSLSRSSDDDEDLRDDPIISLLKQERQGGSRSSAVQSTSRETTTKKSTPIDGSGGITKHRFFEDLEQRMSMPEQPRFGMETEAASSSIVQQGPPSGDSSTLAASNPLKSLFSGGISLPWKQAGMQKDNAPRAPFFARSRAPPVNSDPLSNVAVVSGAAMLSTDELKQLDQAVQQQKQRPIRFGRRETFIAFTLVLAAFVYFFLSRSPTWTRSV